MFLWAGRLVLPHPHPHWSEALLLAHFLQAWRLSTRTTPPVAVRAHQKCQEELRRACPSTNVRRKKESESGAEDEQDRASTKAGKRGRRGQSKGEYQCVCLSNRARESINVCVCPTEYQCVCLSRGSCWTDILSLAIAITHLEQQIISRILCPSHETLSSHQTLPEAWPSHQTLPKPETPTPNF
jgi:hypothetical protein